MLAMEVFGKRTYFSQVVSQGHIFGTGMCLGYDGPEALGIIVFIKNDK